MIQWCINDMKGGRFKLNGSIKSAELILKSIEFPMLSSTKQ